MKRLYIDIASRSPIGPKGPGLEGTDPATSSGATSPLRTSSFSVPATSGPRDSGFRPAGWCLRWSTPPPGGGDQSPGAIRAHGAEFPSSLRAGVPGMANSDYRYQKARVFIRFYFNFNYHI